MGVDRSTYYRLKRRADRWGLEALNVRERRRPRMPNQIGPHLEQRIIAFALGHPGYGHPERHIDASAPGEKVQLDCFYVGRLSGVIQRVLEEPALRSFSASSRNPRTIPNTAWRIVAWPKARRLAASFGSSLRAGW